MDFPKLTPYLVESIISNDSFYTHYKATHVESDSTFIITEFNPSFMVKRLADGVLEPTERFIMEFETALERFTKMGEALADLGEPFIAPIEEILQLNNTVYIVRPLGGRYKSLDDGLKEGKMEYTEAYVVLRPLLQSLVTAWKRGLIFQINPGSLCCTSYGQLMLDSMFAWEGDHRHTIKELTKLYYRLITGVPYNPSIPDNPIVETMGLPPRLSATLKDILMGDPSYGSIDDFNKQLRTVMDVEGKKEILSDRLPTSAAQHREPVTVKKGMALGLIAGVACLVLLLIGIPLLLTFVANQGEDPGYYVVTDNYQEGAPAVTPAPNVPTAFVRLHTAYAITDPRDPSVMLNGSFHQIGNILYHRTYRGGYGLSRQGPDGMVTELVQDVRPAFITNQGRYIFFSDGLSDYNIRRVRTDGSGLETVSGNTASFLLVHGNSLFYTNHSNRDFLYRMDLETFTSLPFIRTSAYEGLINNGQLYFINGSEGFRIYSIPLDQPNTVPLRINDTNSDNLRLNEGHIFYRDVETNLIHRIGTQEPIVPISAAAFDINGSEVAIIEAGTQELWLHNMDTGDLFPTGFFGAYAAMGTGVVNLIDFNDVRFTRQFNIPVAIDPDQELEDQEYSDEEAPNQEVPDQEAPDQEAPDQEAPDQEAPDQEAPDQEVSDEEVPDQETPDQEAPEQEE